MKRFILVLALTCSACIPAPPSTLSTQGQVAYTADQIVLRVNELENAAIQANTTGALSDMVTRPIVEFCVTADTTLKTIPAGWQASVTAAWTSAKKAFPPITNVALLAAISTVDVAIASLGSLTQ